MHCFVQFSHADLLDLLMLSAAILLSGIYGISHPAESYLTGRLVTVYISYNTAEQLNLYSILNNNTCTQSVAQRILNNLANDSDRIFCDATQEGNVINSASAFVCDPDQTLTEEVTTYSLYFVYLAAGTFVTHFLSQMLWAISAARQIRRMRIAYYRSVLLHKVPWFETSDVSKLGPQFLKYA